MNEYIQRTAHGPIGSHFLQKRVEIILCFKAMGLVMLLFFYNKP